MLDLERSLRAYGEQLETYVEPFEIGDLIERPPVPARSVRVAGRRAWVVAIGTAAAVLVLIGGFLALLWQAGGEDRPPVTEPSVPTTTAPMPTTLAPVTETTLPPPTTLAGVQPEPPPATTTPPPPTTAALPPAPVLGVDVSSWEQVPITGDAFILGDVINDVIAGGPGFVAVGQNDPEEGRRDAVVWTSVDGAVWSRVPHDEALFGTGAAWMQRIVFFKGRYLALGRSCDDVEAACPSHPRIWVSSDGTSWKRAPWDSRVLAAHVTINDVTVAIDGSLIAVGTVCLLDGTEPDADTWTKWAFDEDFVDAELTCHFAAWSSADGIAWERTYLDGDPHTGAGAVTANPTGLVAVGEAWDLSIDDNRPAAWTSPDGAAWTRAQAPEDRAGGMQLVVAHADGVVATGWLRGSDRNAHFQMAVWISTDGMSWTLTYDQAADSDVLTLSIGGPGLMVGGSDTGTQPDEPQAAVWASADGVSWTIITGPDSGLPAGFVDEIVAVGREVLAFVKNPDGELVGIWRAPPS